MVGSSVDAVGALLLSLGTALSFACGFSLWQALSSVLSAHGRRKSVLGADAEAAESVTGASVAAGPIGKERRGARSGSHGRFHKRDSANLDLRVMGYACRLSQAVKMDKCRRIAPDFLAVLAEKRFCKVSRLAGYGNKAGVDAFCEASVRLALVCSAVGLALGMVFSSALSALLALAGFFIGFRLPLQSASNIARRRANEMERHLPEMLDVVALGMRSGMSFDSSLILYERHFKTTLACELANLQRQWSSGLVLRDDALRGLAATYDSVIFGRVVETVIRSVRYGSSMVESLESDAADARVAYQASREEMAAKAPVKMMVPTGTLILPAMLILVLGPVLLELMGGGF